MQMPDVNILVYAHREETKEHLRYLKWLTNLVSSSEPFALSELALSGFIRIVTNQKIFKPASSVAQAITFTKQLQEAPNCCMLRPGEQHFEIFLKLCEDYKLSGKLIADAYHAALAIEHGCELVSADTDFARFQGALRFRHL